MRWWLCVLWWFGHDWQLLSERYRGRTVRRCARCDSKQFQVYSDETGGMWFDVHGDHTR